MRALDQSITAETLSAWMQLARLVALSFGGGALKKEHWELVQSLERTRVSRLPAGTATVAAPAAAKAAPRAPEMALPTEMAIPMADDDSD